MKTVFTLLTSTILFAMPSRAQSVLLSDTFKGGTINSTLWTTSNPQSDSSVVQSGGYLTTNNAGFLISKSMFNGALQLETSITLMGERTSGALAWKTNGSYSAGNSSNNTSGIAVVLFNESQSVGIYAKNASDGSNLAFTSVVYPVPLNTPIALKVVDTGRSISVYLNGASTPDALLAYNPALVGDTGKIEFYSRDSNNTDGPVGAKMDHISVTVSPDSRKSVTQSAK